MTQVTAKFLNIYGLTIIYQGQCERLASQLLRPFSTFLTDSASTITPPATIEIRYEKPPYEKFPQLAIEAIPTITGKLCHNVLIC